MLLLFQESKVDQYLQDFEDNYRAIPLQGDCRDWKKWLWYNQHIMENKREQRRCELSLKSLFHNVNIEKKHDCLLKDYPCADVKEVWLCYCR